METTGGYSPKDLHFDKQARSKLIKGISKMSSAVKSTLGPMGNTVLIESASHTHGITVTKDGVTAANAGDGTTTAIVLTEALVRKGIEELEEADNKTQVLRDMVSLTEGVVDNLKKRSRKVSNKKLLDVATISANNDTNVGKIIADTYTSIGKNGIVTVEKAQGSETGFETTNGLKIDRGYSSPLFINDQKKDECIMEDVHILVSDAEINNILVIEGILKPIINEGKKLLIVAPCSQQVINTLAANVMKNSLKLCAIIPPSFGYKQHELMQDIALSVGATYFSEKTGDDMSIMKFEDLGRAKKIIVGKDSSIIIKDDTHIDKKLIDERVAQLWDAHSIAVKKVDKEFILSRVASLTGGVGVIYVGGNTDLEQKELFDRVDDAVCAVRSALEEGILPGAGLALYQEGLKLLGKNSTKKIAEAILGESLQEPLKQIQRNAGIKNQRVYNEKNIGLDVKNDKEGDLVQMGIIDPMKVTKQALQNAVSVAVTILSTNAIVTMARTYETK